MIVRDATIADAPSIGLVHVESWRGTYAGLFPDDFLAGLDAGRRAAGWREAIEHGEPVLVAERARRVVAFASIGEAREEQGVGELYAIYALPEVWGTGAGRALMAAAEERLAAAGHTEAILWVHEENPRARRFYEAAGWSADGGRKLESIGGTDVPEVRYRRVLPGHGPTGAATHP